MARWRWCSVNETAGLSNEEVQRCQMSLSIPTSSQLSSLNLGRRCKSFVMRHVWRLFLGQGVGAAEHASQATPFSSQRPRRWIRLKGFYAHLERLMIETGFQDPQTPKRLLPKLRRLFARAGLESEEVNLLRGIPSAAMPRKE